jgi:dTDP-3-amino-2,3,6-trideoxy-4-keto-D-glucose/dTDP-3-amino-3,4,6-trideoxy-alpha-D-glucose/dTDP-2,6-dideoxy-D-kanosamine transaminase
MSRIVMFDYLEQYNGLQNDIIAAVEQVLSSGQLILGEQVRTFQKGFASFLGKEADGQAVGVNSGTDALAISLMACGVGQGDEVITSTNTAVPTVSAIRMTGATPVFCDVDEMTALMDLEKLHSCLTDKTKAIVPVHLFGNVVDVSRLRSLVADRNIAIVEDCAQAHGARLHGKAVGTLGDASAFSFYPTKNLGAFGDAGLCFTCDQRLAKEMRKIRMYGFEDAYYAEREGINSRMDELQAAILNVKLPYLGVNVEHRRRLADCYNKLLKPSISRISILEGVEHAYHLFVIRVRDRSHVREALAEQGISTGIHYPYPIHLMRGYEFLGYQQGDFPVAEHLSTEILSLPLYPELSEKSVKRVCSTLNAIVE